MKEHNFRALIVPYLHERKIFLGRIKDENDYFQTTRLTRNGMSFFNFNITENKCHVYTQKGILKHRIEYSDQVKKYGKPMSVSNNGMIYIFKKPSKNVLNIMLLTLNGFIFIKQIKIMDKISDHILKSAETDFIKLSDRFGNENDLKINF